MLQRLKDSFINNLSISKTVERFIDVLLDIAFVFILFYWLDIIGLQEMTSFTDASWLAQGFVYFICISVFTYISTLVSLELGVLCIVLKLVKKVLAKK